MIKKSKKILFGVCGIGQGHAYRQLPLIEHFSNTGTVAVFAYGSSYELFKKRCRGKKSVTVIKVAVPFYAGGGQGIDFAASAKLPENKQDFFAINSAAMAAAARLLGRPDVVISDYEPVSAQYAYAVNAPLVTIDQQSKYLCGTFPDSLNGVSNRDEIARLRMFFPAAERRLACSFFTVPAGRSKDLKIEICPPLIRQSIAELKRSKKKAGSRPLLVVYISSQQKFRQSTTAMAGICAACPEIDFHMYVDAQAALPRPPANLKICRYDEVKFVESLGSCDAVIATAGHTLLSELMYLGIPVYAMPLPVYEQQMNAAVIQTYGFGLSSPKLSAPLVRNFVRQLPRFAENINSDRKILVRGTGQAKIISFLEKTYLS